jgi:hypothetical protein
LKRNLARLANALAILDKAWKAYEHNMP